MKLVLTSIALSISSMFVAGQPGSQPLPSTAEVVDLRCEFQTNPEVVNTPLPQFSWRIRTDERGVMQAAYQILVATSADLLAEDKGDLWNPGFLGERRSQFVEFGGVPLQSGCKLHWKVRIRDRAGKQTSWSPPATATIQLSGQSRSDGPVGTEKGRNLSEFQCDNDTLNQIFKMGSNRVSEICGTRDLGLAMRSIGFHSDLLPRGTTWLRGFHQSIDDAGIYPASIPSNGEYGSTRSDSAIGCTHAYWWVTGNTVFVSRWWPTMYSYTLKRLRFDPKMAGLPFGTLPIDTLPAGDPTPPEFVNLMSQAINIRQMIEMAQIASQNPYEMKTLLSYQKELAKLVKTNHFASGTLKYKSLTAVLMAFQSGFLDSVESKASNKALLLEILDGLERNPFSESPFASANLLRVLVMCGESKRAIQIAANQRPGELSPLSLAAISEFLLSTLAGVDASEAGFSGLKLHPQIVEDGQVQYAKATYESPYGPINAHWYRKDQQLCYDVTVPPNTIASVRLPILNGQELLEGGQNVSAQKFVFSLKQSADAVEFRLAPGTYHFAIASQKPEP